MIQRIQSVYLFVAVILQALILFLPVSHFSSTNMTADMFVSGFVNNETVYLTSNPLLVLSLIIILISLVTVFSFKKRIFQMRLCIFNIILNLGLIGFFVFLVYYFSNMFSVQCHSYTWAIILPAISAVLHSLAFRSIRNDENLVKSQDRLR